MIANQHLILIISPEQSLEGLVYTKIIQGRKRQYVYFSQLEIASRYTNLHITDVMIIDVTALENSEVAVYFRQLAVSNQAKIVVIQDETHRLDQSLTTDPRYDKRLFFVNYNQLVTKIEELLRLGI